MPSSTGWWQWPGACSFSSVTFQRKLLLGVSLMVLPALLIGAEAIRSNALEQRALETLGERLGRNRIYAELETAMFDQSEVIWRYLSGLDPSARKEFVLAGQVVDYRFEQWKSELGPDETQLADAIAAIQRQFVAVGDSVFTLVDHGKREQAYAIAQVALKTNLQPALTSLNRQIYRRTRESSVQGAFARVEGIVQDEKRVLVAIFLVALAAGIGSAWFMARSLAHPISELRQAMAVVGGGNLDHPIESRSRDEIGELAIAFAGMTAQLRESRDRLVQSEKLASIGEMAAAVAHGLRNPLASLRASAQLVLRHPELPRRRRTAPRHHRGGGSPRPADHPSAHFLPAGAIPSAAGAGRRAGPGGPAGVRGTDQDPGGRADGGRAGHPP